MGGDDLGVLVEWMQQGEAVEDDFARGLDATIAWYADHEAWWRPQKARTEAQYAAQGQ